MTQRDFQGVLNDLAGTTGLAATAAANRYAGTSRLELLAALNVKAGTQGKGLRAVCNIIAGGTDLDPVGALNYAFNAVLGDSYSSGYGAVYGSNEIGSGGEENLFESNFGGTF